jgi:heat shock protein HslJ
MGRKLVWFAFPGVVLVVGVLLWVAVFPPLPAELKDSRWRLDRLGAIEGPGYWSPDQAGQFTLEFDSDRLIGFAACNSYEGTYYLNRYAGFFSVRQLSWTEIGCLEEEAQREQQFFYAMETATRYDVTAYQLRLYFDDGMKELVFWRVEE